MIQENAIVLMVEDGILKFKNVLKCIFYAESVISVVLSQIINKGPSRKNLHKTLATKECKKAKFMKGVSQVYFCLDLMRSLQMFNVFLLNSK